MYNCTQAVEEKIIKPVEKLQSVEYSKDLLSLVQPCSSIGGCRQNWSGSSKRFPWTVYSRPAGRHFHLALTTFKDYNEWGQISCPKIWRFRGRPRNLTWQKYFGYNVFAKPGFLIVPLWLNGVKCEQFGWTKNLHDRINFPKVNSDLQDGSLNVSGSVGGIDTIIYWKSGDLVRCYRCLTTHWQTLKDRAT